MKKMINIFVLLLFIIKIYSLELVKEIRLKKDSIKNFSKLYSADYDLNTKQLVVVATLKDLTPKANIKTNSNITFKGVFVFSNEGKLLGKVGKFNSYEKDGILIAEGGKFSKEYIYIRDSKKDGLMLFSKKRPYKYIGSIFNDIPDKYFGKVSIIKNGYGFILSNRDHIVETKNGKYFYKKDKFKKVAFGKIISTDNPEIFKLKDLKRLACYKKYFNFFWNDKKLL